MVTMCGCDGNHVCCYGNHVWLIWCVLCIVAMLYGNHGTACVLLNNASTMFNVISAGSPRTSDFRDFIDFFTDVKFLHKNIRFFYKKNA